MKRRALSRAVFASLAGACAADSAFELASAPHANLPQGWTDSRGYHATGVAGGPGIAWGVGITGEITGWNLSVPTEPQLVAQQSAVNRSELLYQARTVYDAGAGFALVGAKDLLVYDMAVGPHPKLVQRVEVPQPQPGFQGRDIGINGLVSLGCHGDWEVLVGCTMRSALLVAFGIRQSATASRNPPRVVMLGYWNASSAGVLESTFDVSGYPIKTARAGATSSEFRVATVSARLHHRRTMFVVVKLNVTDAPDGGDAPPVASSWTLESRPLVDSSTGCNRVYLRQDFAYVSCFGNNTFITIAAPQTEPPAVLSVQPFVDEQPTGMLASGSALFVAGGRDMMVFNISTPSRPMLVATCGSPCRGALQSPGQNAHGVALLRPPHSGGGSEVYLLVTAQIDNNLGVLRITSEKVLALINSNVSET